MELYNQLLLQGLAAIILRLTIVSVQRGTCARIKVECCVYIPELSGYISDTLDDMKGQIKVMSDDNLPFWPSVLSWVKGDWWKTVFTTVTVALMVLLSGPFTYNVLWALLPEGWCRSPRLEVGESGCNLSLWMMLILWVKSIKSGEWRRKQTEQAPSWKQDSILGQTVEFELYDQYLCKRRTNWKTRPPGWKSPRART